MSNAHVEGAVRMPVCPVCGNDGIEDEILYVEAVEYRRRVLRVEDGALHVEADFRTDEGPEGSGYPLFECQKIVEGGICGHRWPVPPQVDASVDFVVDDSGE